MACYNLLCLLLGVLYLGQGQGYSDIRNCLFRHYYKDLPACRDVQGAIDCIQKIPEVSDDVDKTKTITESLNHLYQDLNASSCPELQKQGKCLSMEINKCFEDKNFHCLLRERKITQLCLNIPAVHRCLESLKSVCDNEVLDFHIKKVENDVESCTSGWFRSYMRDEKCYAAIDMCTEEFQRDRRLQQYSESCELIPSIKQCYRACRLICHGDYLDRVTAALKVEEEKCELRVLPPVKQKVKMCQKWMESCTFGFNKLFEEGSYQKACGTVLAVGRCLGGLRRACSKDADVNAVIANTMAKCPADFANAVCNYKAIYACSSNIPQDMNRAHNAVNNNCTKADLDAARACLSNLQPYCSSRDHLNLIQEDLGTVYQYCQFPRPQQETQ